jgi:hypothetical protein
MDLQSINERDERINIMVKEIASPRRTRLPHGTRNDVRDVYFGHWAFGIEIYL